MSPGKDVNPFPSGYSIGPFSAQKGLPAWLQGTPVLQQGLNPWSWSQASLPLTVLSWDSWEGREG